MDIPVLCPSRTRHDFLGSSLRDARSSQPRPQLYTNLFFLEILRAYWGLVMFSGVSLGLVVFFMRSVNRLCLEMVRKNPLK